MSQFATSPDKTGQHSKPARIELVTGETYDVSHHFVSDREQYVVAYETDRSDGIDYRFPLANVSVIDTTGELERVESGPDGDCASQTLGSSNTASTVSRDDANEWGIELPEIDSGQDTEAEDDWNKPVVKDPADAEPGDCVRVSGEFWTVRRTITTARVVELEPVTEGARAMCPEPRAGDSPSIDVAVTDIEELQLSGGEV